MNEQLIQYINESRKKGIKDPEIKQNLLNAGWLPVDIDHALKNSTKKKYNPSLMALSNIIIPGGSYLILGMYFRFFVTYGIIVVSLFVPYLIWVLILSVIADTYVQSLKVNSEEKIIKKKKIFTIIGVLFGMMVFVLIIFLPALIINFLPPSLCRYLYIFDRMAMVNCTIRRIGNEIDSKVNKAVEQARQSKQEKKVVDTECEVWKSDIRLRQDAYGANYIRSDYEDQFVFACYLKKAFESKNPNYCYSATFFSFDCINVLAMKFNNTTICDTHYNNKYEKQLCYGYLALYNKRLELCPQYVGSGGPERCELIIRTCQTADINSDNYKIYHSYCEGNASGRISCEQHDTEVRKLCEDEFGELFRLLLNKTK